MGFITISEVQDVETWLSSVTCHLARGRGGRLRKTQGLDLKLTKAREIFLAFG
jgi:hypothetical protein